MLKRILSLLLCFLALTLLVPASAEQGYLAVASPAETVRPGKAITIVFEAPAGGEANIRLYNAQNQVVSVIAEGYQAAPGRNELWWNGTWQGIPAPEGSYTLTVEIAGETASAAIHVGAYAPYMYQVVAINPVCTVDEPVQISFVASVGGVFTGGVILQDGTQMDVLTQLVDAGENVIEWDGVVSGVRLPAQ